MISKEKEWQLRKQLKNIYENERFVIGVWGMG